MNFDVSAACTGCGKCVKDCATGILALKDGRPAVRNGRGDDCMDCQHCVAVCPAGAVRVNGVGADDCVPLESLPIPPPNEVANLLATRRSVRQFAREDIPRGEIAELLETLKYVPTGCNIRHLVFKVVDSRARMDDLRARLRAEMETHYAQLPDRMKAIVDGWRADPACDVFFRHAPHLLVVTGDSKAVTPQTDCDAACAYFDLLAQAAGLGTVWFGFLTHIVHAVPEAADLFGIPRGAPFHAMLFGAPAVDYVRGVNRSAGARIEWL